MTKDEAMRLALEALSDFDYDKRMEAITVLRKALANEALNRMAENARELELDYWMHDHARKVWWDGEKLASKQIPLEQLYKEPAQQEPVAYDKTELNCFAQDLYDQKMREGKHGHYESMFHVIHQCVKKVASPPPQRTWVGLTDDERVNAVYQSITPMFVALSIEAKLKEKNNA